MPKRANERRFGYVLRWDWMHEAYGTLHVRHHHGPQAFPDAFTDAGRSTGADCGRGFEVLVTENTTWPAPERVLAGRPMLDLAAAGPRAPGRGVPPRSVDG